MTVAYATSAQLAVWLGTLAPTEADRMLQRASELIDGLVCAPFDVDGVTNLPTDAAVAEALQKAACAVVEQWVEAGEANDIDGLAGTTLSVGGYSGKRAPRLGPRARDALRAANLLRVGA